MIKADDVALLPLSCSDEARRIIGEVVAERDYLISVVQLVAQNFKQNRGKGLGPAANIALMRASRNIRKGVIADVD